MTVATFPIYRAEPLTPALQAGGTLQPLRTVRLPSNVPYVVDNLWEFLRPDDMPSRRHALYASPTRELARRHRSGVDQGLGFCVYRLEVEGVARIVHLHVRDAREHPDIRAVLRLVQAAAQDLAATPADEQALVALMFLPGAGPAEWKRARAGSALAARLIDASIAVSTFWQDATSTPDVTRDSELFLQLLDGAVYRPVDIEPYRQD